MKTGILTFSNANNHGAALQAFSLLQKMNKMGFRAEIIDYRCPAIEAMHAKKSLRGGSVKRKLYNLWYNIVFSRRRRAFSRFRAVWATDRVYTPETIWQANKAYDLFVSGSDQVFNLSLTKGDTAFFLAFAEPGKQKASYAASFGLFLPEQAESYRQLLSSFQAVSVREPSAAENVRSFLGIDCVVSPDPVFLHSAEEWRNLLHLRPQKKTAPFLLIYALIEKPELYQIGNEIARQLGLPTVAITKALHPAGHADRFVRDAGPVGFVSLIDQAAYVVSNSFHGTAFSLIFKKPFSVLPLPRTSSRITDLLSALSLLDRICGPDGTLGETGALDGESLSAQLTAMRAKGEAYLTGLLEIEKNERSAVSE